MVAFFVWGPHQIINAINVREQYFPNESADVFLCERDETSIRKDAHILRENKYFDNVFFLPFGSNLLLPTNDRKGFISNILTKLQYYQNVFFSNNIHKQLQSLIGDKKYRKFLIPGAWTEAFQCASYFIKQNDKLEIEFYEGAAGSNFTEFDIATGKKLDPYFNTKKTYYKNLIKNIAAGQNKINRFISKNFYLYGANAYDKTLGAHPIKINMGNMAREYLNCIHTNVNKDTMDLYNNHDFYYFAINNQNKYQNGTYKPTRSQLDAIIESVGAEKLLVRPHLRYMASWINECGKYYKDKIALDCDNESFEHIACGIQGLSNKVFINLQSNLPFTVKWYYNAEPFIILTHKLFPYYDYYRENAVPDPYADKSAEFLKKIYSDPSRVYVPEDLGNFKSMLLEIDLRINKNKQKHR